MFTIFKKELKAFFRRGSGLFFAAALLLSVGIFSFVYNLNIGFSGIEILLPILSIIFAAFLPILTFDIFASDRANGNDKLLYSLHFKSEHIVFGKYAAMLCFFGAEVVLLALLPVVFGFFGTVNYLSAYLSLICFVLFGAAILAMCMFISAATKSKLLTVIISYASVVAAFLLYLIPIGITENFWMTAAKMLRFLSPFSHLDSFSVGIVKLTSVLYFVIFTALFLFLAIRAENKKRAVLDYGKGSDQTKRFSLSPVFAIILCVCTVITTSAISFLPFRFTSLDATSSKSITLSKATKEYLSSLKCEVDIYVINADGTDRRFEHLVKLYDEYSDKLNTKYVYQDDVKDKLMALGWDGASSIDPYLLLIESEYGRSQIFHPDLAYYYYHPEFGNMSESTYQQYYQTLSQYAQAYPEAYQEVFASFVNNTESYSNVEQQLTPSIEHTAFDIIPGAYYLTGHGETEPEKSNFYSFLNSASIGLKGTLELSSAAKLPKDASCLIINAPTNDISSEDLAIIKEFLANGGALTLITNEANLDMPNLMSLLADYGVSAKKGVVSFDYKAAAEKAEAEKKESEKADAKTTEEEKTYPDNDIVYAQINTSHSSLAALASFPYPAEIKRANHIDVASDIRSSVTVTPLLVTDKECFIENVENSTGAKTLAVVIEEKVGDTKTQLSWYTGADSVDSENMQMATDMQIAPVYAAAYSIIWSIDEPTSQLDEIAPKLVVQNYLDMNSTAVYILLVVMIVILPCALVIIGALARSKYKKNPFAPKEEAIDENTEEPEEPEEPEESEENTEE